jgi:3-hydroxyacyl-CoA dehydrogenase / enoyl-CoA hydratase / 3-hydroxybutyryl-CoA epimerase
VTVTAPVSFSVDADRVGWIIFDDPAARANVLNASTLAALDSCLTAAGEAKLHALIIRSAKERIFIAGADLNVLAGLNDRREAEAMSRGGQRLFARLAAFECPVICAIQGACAGGGFELALACGWRMASDSSATQIGLPETSIGTIPGWGGTVRLSRLIGAPGALEHILAARLLPAAETRAAGLIDEVVPAEELYARAKARALALAASPAVRRVAEQANPGVDFFAAQRMAILARTRGHLPAQLAAIDAMAQTVGLPVEPALEVESRIFSAVTVGATCKHLIRAFFLRDAAKKRTLAGWFPDATRADAAGGRRIQRVGVVGAGVMGSGIAQFLAQRGVDVVLRDVRPELVARGLEVARRLFDQAVKRGALTAGAANAGLQRITTTTGWDGFGACDLVIEAIVENTAAKRQLFTELAGVVRPDALLASNTSALPIEEIAGHVSSPERALGLHFFNPVSRMPLVELVLARHTAPAAAEAALGFVKSLGKTPVICRSSPGFLVTRVLFFYLNEAVALWEAGEDTAALDAAMRDFGWPMGPLRLIDEVGMDVTDFILGEMAHYFPERFRRSSACGRLLAAGLLGRKNGASRGFYRYEGGNESPNDDETRRLAAAAARGGTGVGQRPAQTEITRRLMRVMTEEAERCLAEGVVQTADDIDFALLSGTGFPSFRGGLLHWARTNAPVGT